MRNGLRSVALMRFAAGEPSEIIPLLDYLLVEPRGAGEAETTMPYDIVIRREREEERQAGGDVA